MAIQYIKFKLTPGQKAPINSTGVCLSNGDVVWKGEEGTFNDSAFFGLILETDPDPASQIENYIMTENEIDEYILKLLQVNREE